MNGPPPEHVRPEAADGNSTRCSVWRQRGSVAEGAYPNVSAPGSRQRYLMQDIVARASGLLVDFTAYAGDRVCTRIVSRGVVSDGVAFEAERAANVALGERCRRALTFPGTPRRAQENVRRKRK